MQYLLLVYFSYSYLSRWKESWDDKIPDVLEGLGWDIVIILSPGS